MEVHGSQKRHTSEHRNESTKLSLVLEYTGMRCLMKRCNKWDPCERIGPFHKRGFDKHKVVNVDKWGDPLRAKTMETRTLKTMLIYFGTI